MNKSFTIRILMPTTNNLIMNKAIVTKMVIHSMSTYETYGQSKTIT